MTEVARNHTTTEHAKTNVPAQTQEPKAAIDAPSGAKKDASSDSKNESKAEPKPDTKTDLKPDAKADANRGDVKNGAPANGGAKADDKASTKADDKPKADDSAKTDGAKAEVKGDTTPVAALGSQALEVVSQVATQAKQAVSTRVAEQTDRGAEDLGDVAKALRKTSRQLDGNIASPLVEKAAEQLERASEFLQTANPGQMAQAVQTFARREPLLFLGGAFAAGIVVARFLKSTSHREDDDSAAENDEDAGNRDEEGAAAAQFVAEGGAQPQHAPKHHKRHGRKHRRH